MNDIAERYMRFARVEAAGRSPLYETLARHVAKSPGTLAFLERLPRHRQQPNLLFAALRLVAGTPESVAEFDHVIDEHAKPIAEVMLTRTTQTYEPGRCAVLLPSLAQIKGPIALIEVGASAGLCLLPDFYGYDWGPQRILPPARLSANAPVFQCNASEGTPLPVRQPEIVWRAGLDLNPLQMSNDDDVAWLETLVWPEHQERLSRLRKAIQIARTELPIVIAGDLRQDLPMLIAEAPRDAAIVVFHTAVLNYVTEQSDRDDFAAGMIDDSRVIWLSNEAPRTFSRFASAAGPVYENMFLLAVDGRPVAWTGPHGQEIGWL